MAVTLADAMKQTDRKIQKGIMIYLLRYSDLLGLVPFETIDALEFTVTRWNTLPAVGWRKYNEGYDEATGDTEQVSWSMCYLGGDVDVDVKLQGRGNFIEDPVVTQTKMKTKAVSYEFNDTFINGDKASDEDEFNGIKYRVSKFPARQTIDLASSGDALKVQNSSANRHTFLDALHQAMRRCDGGASALLMNEHTLEQFSSLLRQEALLDVTRDVFDRRVENFLGAPLVDVGLKADQTTEIITSTEDPGDAGDDSTSIYAVHFEVGEGLCGIQDGPIDMYLVTDELEAKPASRRRIDWGVGLAHWGERSIVRVKGFKMATA